MADAGAWRALTGAQLEPLVIPGQALPAAADPASYVSALGMNESGTAAMLVQFPEGRGIYQSSGDALQPVAVIGQEVGAEPLVFGRDIRWPVINDHGEMLFYADASDPLTGARRVGYWVANDSGVEQQPLLDDFRFGFSDEGRVAFSRVIPFQNGDYGVLVAELGSRSQSIVLREGSPAPGTASVFSYPQPPSVNDSGRFVVHVSLGPLTGPSEGTGLWTGDANDLVPVALSGDNAPAISAVFERFSHRPSINNAGQIAFSAFLRGDDTLQQVRQSLWKGLPGALSEVARQGDPAPGADAFFGRLASDASGSLYSSESGYFAFNDRGQMAFIAEVTGPGVTPEDDTGLWAESVSGELRLILREGDFISVGNNDLRQVSGFRFRAGAGSHETYGGGFTDQGLLALRVDFTDGSQAVLVNSSVVVPEPATAAILLSILALLQASRAPPASRFARTASSRSRVHFTFQTIPPCN